MHPVTIAHATCQATVSGGLGAAALVDLLVALTLTFYLKRNRTDFHKCVVFPHPFSA